VGLRDIITGRHTVSGPAKDRLFAITTAYVTLQAEHAIEPAGVAAIVFQALQTSEFESTLRDMEEVVRATGGESGTSVTSEDDDYGYRWLVLRNQGEGGAVEDLTVGINAVSSSIETAGYGERLLCAVFAFTDRSGAPRGPGLADSDGAGGDAGRKVYFIYNYKRGYWYPFVPAPNGNNERSTERELQLKAKMASELPIEPELERWFPLWGIPSQLEEGRPSPSTPSQA
jgi:PspA associated protein B